MARTKRPTPLGEDEIRRMREMREEGASVLDIARRMGIGESTASRKLRGTKRLFGVDEQPRLRGRPRKPTGCGVTHSVQP